MLRKGAAVILLAAAGSATTLVAQVRLASPSSLVGVRVSGRTVATPGTSTFDDVALLASLPTQTRLFRAPVKPGQPFVFDNVPPGTYRLSLQTHHGFRSMDVVVGRQPVRDLELSFIRMLDVDVSVHVNDGGVPPGALLVRAKAPGGPLTDVFARTLPAGLRMTLPAGRTWLFVPPQTGYFVIAVTAGGVDLQREPIVLSGTDAAPSIRIDLSRTPPLPRPGTTITGRLTGGQPGVEVLLAEHTDAPNRLLRLVARATTTASGAFTLENVAPGIYTLHLDPARDVLRGIVVLDEPVSVTVDVPRGSIVATAPVQVVDAAGRLIPSDWPEPFTLTATAGATKVAHRLRREGSWTALAPGTYQVTIDDLAPRFRVRSMTAGSVDLLKSPLVVPADRPAELITIVIER